MSTNTNLKQQHLVYWASVQQASAYEACDRTRTPLHMPKTLETCKKKHVLFNSKSFKVIARRLKQQRFYLSLSLSVVAIILEINKKGKNAASLALNRC